MSGMSNNPWECEELSEAPAGWIPATENGWGALVVWAAGPGNVVRVPAAPRDRHTVVVTHYPDGSEHREPSMLSDAELESIDDDIDAYLDDAGLPPRPRGYDWFIRRPQNTGPGDDAFWAAVWSATAASLPHEAMDPSKLKSPARDALARMYQG
ncbi:hypothetical protein JYA52_15160 [Arthrobacter pascens]|nr:hypothetical protein [Arthrobacter pascens]